MNNLYITTSIPYVNGSPHLGHALEFVHVDVLARHRRRRGGTVRVQSGTDDHAIKNVSAASSAGVAVADLVAVNGDRFADLAAALGVHTDEFLRTSSDPRHTPGVTALWDACKVAGEEPEDLVATLLRRDDQLAAGDELGDLVAVAGEPEEPVGLGDLLDRCPVLLAQPVDQLVRCVELFAARAVQAGVVLLVQVAGGLAGVPQGGDAWRVPRVAAGSQELVGVDPEGCCEVGEPVAVNRDQVGHGNAGT